VSNTQNLASFESFSPNLSYCRITILDSRYTRPSLSHVGHGNDVAAVCMQHDTSPTANDFIIMVRGYNEYIHDNSPIFR